MCGTRKTMKREYSDLERVAKRAYPRSYKVTRSL
jgi:hypothetical protein